jgi:hypothetical protein
MGLSAELTADAAAVRALGFFGSYAAFQVVTAALLALAQALRSSATAALPSRALLAAALICPADGASRRTAAVVLDAGVHDLAAADAESAVAVSRGQDGPVISHIADRASASSRRFKVNTRTIATYIRCLPGQRLTQLWRDPRRD